MHGLFRTIGLAAVCLVTVLTSVQAQTSLELVDQLPPYLLSARLLNNGHFSITTRYTSESKTLIYREDGTGNRPVNYTSHLHVKVDDVVYQMPYEADPGTDLPPPPNPLKVLRLFRDTVAQRPRINALLLAHLPNNDSIRVTFTMEPVQRPSGGFIRLSAAVENAGDAAHNVGVLMLIDTKIGDNDRAPIGTAFGYAGVETEFRTSTPPGIPEFWIAFEGTPLAPGLTARGNLSATELIEPDRFLFGNWVDDNSTGTPGLYRVLWDERTPSGLSFTDSAILLLWEQQQLNARVRRLLAATEIGIVDSLDVAFGTGNGGGSGGGGGSLGVAGPGSCIQVSTNTEDTCGQAGYHPYSPDVVTSLFVVTNTGTSVINGLNVHAGIPPLGVNIVASPTPVISSTLAADETGIGLQSFSLRPRLAPTTYLVPVHFIDDNNDTILTNDVCIDVPGILASIDGKNTITLPVCPGQRDTFSIPVELLGVRCLPVSQATVIGPAGAPARVVSPLPLLPAGGVGNVLIESAPIAEGTIDVLVRVVVRDWESLVDGDTTWVDVVDTVTVTIIGKHAEFTALTPGDTLVLPRICVGDTTLDSLQLQNVGGCSLDITSAVLSNNAGGVFALDGRTSLPLTIGRSERGQVYVSATSTIPGTYIGELEITSIARPGTIRIPVKVFVDMPAYTIPTDTLHLDTICVSSRTAAALLLSNPTGCDVRIDSVRSLGPEDLTISPINGFTIGPRSNVSLALSLQPSFQGYIVTVLRIYSSEGGDRDVVVTAYSSNTKLDVTGDLDLGRTRVGLTSFVSGNTITLTNRGTRNITITGIRVQGPHPNDFRVTPGTGVTLPYTITQLRSASFDVSAKPSAIGDRSAIVTFTTDRPLCEATQPVTLTTYGVQPLLDVERHEVQPGRICLGSSMDTTITIRNLGNDTLKITQITSSDPALVTPMDVLPIKLDSGQQSSIVLRLTPGTIGDEAAEVSISTDGDWFTPQDTTIRVGMTTVLCATLWADTVEADVGTIENVRLHLKADERSTMTDAQIAQAIAIDGRPIDLSINVDPSLGRYQANVGGQLAGALTTVAPDNIRIEAASLNDPSQTDLAILQADILLGDALRSPLTIDVHDLVGGYHDLRIGAGLLRAQYCALDQRRVQVASTPVMMNMNGTDVRLIGVEGGSVDVGWYTLTGNSICTSEYHIGPGEVVVLQRPPVANGPVFLVVTYGSGVSTAVVH